MREKLIELLRDVQYLGGLEEKVADHLIANGVTIAKDNNVPSKWIPVAERLPEEDGCYLVAVENDHERRYSKTSWFTRQGESWFCLQSVTHWMPLPEPPKGE